MAKTPDELKPALGAIMYEVQSLADAALLLAKNDDTLPLGAEKKNAYLEAMLVHARCLAQFLLGSGGKPPYIQPRDFIDGFDLPDESVRKQLGEYFTLISAHLSHLSWERAAPDWSAEEWLDNIPDFVLDAFDAFSAKVTKDRPDLGVEIFGTAIQFARLTLAKRPKTGYTTNTNPVSSTTSTVAHTTGSTVDPSTFLGGP